MKTSLTKTVFLSALLLGINFSLVNATIHYVDGAGGQTNYYATISAAISAASAGDTVLVSPGKYYESAGITIDKKIILIGSGYRNLNNGGTHIVNAITLTAAASGTKILGFRFINGQVLVNSGCNNVIIANNFFNANNQWGLSIQGGQGDSIRNNIFHTTTVAVNGTNHNVNNNIFVNGSNNGRALWIENVTNLKIYNNIFGSVSYAIFLDANFPLEIKVTSNIFYSCTNITNYNNYQFGLYGNNHKWNIQSGAYEPIVDYPNTTGDPLFTLFSGSYSYTDNPATDTDFRLQDGSPAIDAGFNDNNFLGTGIVYTDNPYHGGKGNARADCGIYGGPFPFPSPQGWPIFPTVKSLSLDKSVVQPGGTVNITIEGVIQSFPGRGN